jgi:hypothetical protein
LPRRIVLDDLNRSVAHPGVCEVVGCGSAAIFRLHTHSLTDGRAAILKPLVVGIVGELAASRVLDCTEQPGA